MRTLIFSPIENAFNLYKTPRKLCCVDVDIQNRLHDSSVGLEDSNTVHGQRQRNVLRPPITLESEVRARFGFIYPCKLAEAF